LPIDLQPFAAGKDVVHQLAQGLGKIAVLLIIPKKQS
jgi:hypothetical protein